MAHVLIRRRSAQTEGDAHSEIAGQTSANEKAVADAQRETQLLKTKEAELRTEGERLKKLAEDERFARAKIEIELAHIRKPRGLIWNNAEEAALRPFAGTPFVVFVYRDDDSVKLAQFLIAILKSLGWVYQAPQAGHISGVIEVPGPVAGERMFEAVMVGVHVNAPRKWEKPWMALLSWFYLAEIDANGLQYSDPNLQEEPIQIIIGQKSPHPFQRKFKP